ncbi:MAG: AsmA-like C-terminal region-containing protein [Pirellulales bacterium]
MEKLQGKFTYCDGRVELENFRAEHGTTRLAAHGNCQLSSDGTWRLKLDPMSVDRLRADRDLVQALSGRLKKAMMDLRPTGGPINLRGTLELASGGSPGSPITAAWDLELHLQQCHLDCGVELAHLNGRIHLAGAFDGLQYHAYGGLKIDSVIYKGFQFTEVMGPIWLDDKQVLLGLWADQQRGVKPQHHVTARLYGGRLVGDLWVKTGPSPRYALQATLTEADLGRWARESAAGPQQLSGQVWATLNLRGKGQGAHNLGGNGSVQLRNADLYELPVMLALLKTLSGRPPDTTAFTTSDVDFVVEGEHVYLKRIDCNGDAISLRGTGELGLDRGINMTFYTIVGRGGLRIPLVDQIGGFASQQILRIHVGGTLDNPQTRREVLPVVAQTLQQLQLPPPAEPAAGGLAPRRGPAPPRRY